MIKIDYKAGERFGMLMTTGKRYVQDYKTYIEVICTNCDTVKWVRRDAAKRQKSCGCIHDCSNNKGVITHGLSKHPLYSVYRSILNRCYTKNNISYNKYGGMGVTMCEEWKNNFASFYKWCMDNGWQSDLELDKDIKYNAEFGTKTGKIYSPDYCSIVTRKINSQYKSTTVYLDYNGQKKTLTEWAKYLNIRPNVIAVRLFHKWTVEKTLSTPLRKQRPRLLRLPGIESSRIILNN